MGDVTSVDKGLGANGPHFCSSSQGSFFQRWSPCRRARAAERVPLSACFAFLTTGGASPDARPPVLARVLGHAPRGVQRGHEDVNIFDIHKIVLRKVTAREEHIVYASVADAEARTNARVLLHINGQLATPMSSEAVIELLLIRGRNKAQRKRWEVGQARKGCPP